MDEREEKRGERTKRKKAQTSFNGGLTEKIVFAQTRDLYEKAPPLKGKTFLIMLMRGFHKAWGE